MFASTHNHGWNMDPPLYTWDEGTVKIMNWKGRFGSKEDEDNFICWQGHGISFLGCTWYNFHWLSSKRENNQWQVLCELMTAFVSWNQEEMAAFGEKKVPFHQDNAPYLPDLAPRIIFSFQTWRNGSVFKDLPTMKRWSLRYMAFWGARWFSL